jgi:hypothetical protein
MRQRKELPRNGPVTPTDHGINRSQQIMRHEIADGFKVLAEIEQEANGERCEHGVVTGSWCEACNREYKEAAADKENVNGK